jgi:type 1 glutamine amidotransferase
MMNRRGFLAKSLALGAALALSDLAVGWCARAAAPRRRILMFTRSGSYEHDVVRRDNGRLSLAERIVTNLGHKHGFDVVCTKDGRVFLEESLAKFDAFLFETQGDPTREGLDKQPPMPPEGKRELLKAIASGKGFVGCHCASDTFNSAGESSREQPREALDPYIAMLGGEFVSHGPQQKARLRVADATFPGVGGRKEIELMEEWYALKNFAPDLHVILVQETAGMQGPEYGRASYPATWARRHQQGRVFYTSLGHRPDVWESAVFQDLLLGGLAWATGDVDTDVRPNLDKVSPHARDLPRRTQK